MNIYGITPGELERQLSAVGAGKVAAAAVYREVYRNRGASPDGFSNVSGRVKAFLKENYSFSLPQVAEVLENGQAAKLLLSLEDGNVVEAAQMKHGYGSGLCISSQIGCNMGCAFCESGRQKKIRSLSAAEMTGQVLAAGSALKTEIKHIDVMGIGEPFDNFDNVADFARIVNDDNGLAFGKRHITVSTSGLVPQIYRFADENVPANLAVSLHAPNDEIRSELMPVNNAYPLAELIKAVKYCCGKTRRKITFEYLLLAGINDGDDCARELAGLVAGINCYVNLIMYNSTANSGFKTVSAERLNSFTAILKENGVFANLRHEYGSELQAACGQLRSSYIKEKK